MDRFGIRPLSVLSAIFAFEFIIVELVDSRVCFGTSDGASHPKSSQEERLRELEGRLSNCSKVEGNLELVFLTGWNVKLNFLRSIEEVTGYVLIVSTHAKVVPLVRLKIIRGQTLFRAHDPETKEAALYSLYVAMNHMDSLSDVGLHELAFISLTEITTGNVLIGNNRLLCHAGDVMWSDITVDPLSKVTVMQSEEDNNRFCEECPDVCRVQHAKVNNRSHCWTTKFCQKLNRLVCSENCEGRCFGQRSSECCHSECASGCEGPTSAQCHFCRHYKDGDRCVAMCPPITVLGQKSKTLIHNPGGKFVHQSNCVQKCPDHMLVDKGVCVIRCADGFTAGVDNVCTPCLGACPKTCKTEDNDWIHSGNIEDFINCTSVLGRLQILDVSFHGDTKRNIGEMSVDSLYHLIEVVEISDFLEINTHHPELTNLTFLKNLRFIHGRNPKALEWALIIQSASVEFLGFESLESIRNGGIRIKGNANLCYVDAFHWSSVVKEGSKVLVLGNRNATLCEREGSICSTECTSEGCTGGSNSHCKSCLNVEFEGRCLASCDDPSVGRGLHPVQGSNRCSPCHPQCLRSCTGPGDEECVGGCSQFEERGRCVESCTSGWYPDEENVCRECATVCRNGCTGRNPWVGQGGCNECHLAILDGEELDSIDREEPTAQVALCIEPFNDTMTCAEGFYLDRSSNRHKAHRGVCKRCDDRCQTCSGPGNSFSSCSCRALRERGRCVLSCSSNFYEADDDDDGDDDGGGRSKGDGKGGECRECHHSCSGCNGPEPHSCTSCNGFVLLEEPYDLVDNASLEKFNCTQACPPEFSHIRKIGAHLVCVKQVLLDRSPLHVITWMIPAVGFSVVSVMIITIVVRSNLIRKKFSSSSSSDDKNSRLLTQTSDKIGKPDMSRLRVINESELKRGNVIGSGAFGTVYKGHWIPAGRKMKISVAIKVLQDENDIHSDGQDSLLEEARIMASVVHPCCLHILAVCLTSPMMLVTQLMPLGCLLEYIKKNKSQIGAKPLLNWSLQIAKGMSYLEQHNIVHRDLAARNVLLQSIDHVKITDFGLAKMINSDVGEFHSSGGKLPIKWLALESIKNRIFSHKSDIWSYGVTLWELFTFGQRPYDNVVAASVLQLLERGERLPQPDICTIDVYMIMIKCWLVDSSSRPSFNELSEEFGKMVQDPGQYLSCPADAIIKAVPRQTGVHNLKRSLSHHLDCQRTVLDEFSPNNAEPPHGLAGKVPSVKVRSTRNEAKPHQMVTSNKHRTSFPLGRMNIPRWKLGGRAAPSMSKETSFTACRYSPSPHFCKSSPRRRMYVPAQTLHQSVSSPDELIFSPNSNTSSQTPLSIPHDASGYLCPDKDNPAYLQLIGERSCASNSEPDTADQSGKEAQPNSTKSELQSISFDNPEYFQKQGLSHRTLPATKL